MNWYNIYKLSSQYEDESIIIEDSINYDPYDIGHGKRKNLNEKASPFQLWVYSNREVRVTKPFKPERGWHETHGETWRNINFGSVYYGRYETKTGRISIIVPETMKFRSIPTVLLSALKSKFGNITKTYVF